MDRVAGLGVAFAVDMSLLEEFEAALARVKGLAAAPSNQVLLEIGRASCRERVFITV